MKDIAEINAKKEALEDEILVMLKEFERETGRQIKTITLSDYTGNIEIEMEG